MFQDIPMGLRLLVCLFTTFVADLWLWRALDHHANETRDIAFLNGATSATCVLIDIEMEQTTCGGGDSNQYPCLHAWGVYQVKIGQGSFAIPRKSLAMVYGMPCQDGDRCLLARTLGCTSPKRSMIVRTIQSS